MTWRRQAVALRLWLLAPWLGIPRGTWVLGWFLTGIIYRGRGLCEDGSVCHLLLGEPPAGGLQPPRLLEPLLLLLLLGLLLFLSLLLLLLLEAPEHLPLSRAAAAAAAATLLLVVVEGVIN